MIGQVVCLTPSDVGTVLAALRHYQKSFPQGEIPADLQHHFEGLQIPLHSRIDDLCARINSGGNTCTS